MCVCVCVCASNRWVEWLIALKSSLPGLCWCWRRLSSLKPHIHRHIPAGSGRLQPLPPRQPALQENLNILFSLFQFILLWCSKSDKISLKQLEALCFFTTQWCGPVQRDVSSWFFCLLLLWRQRCWGKAAWWWRICGLTQSTCAVGREAGSRGGCWESDTRSHLMVGSTDHKPGDQFRPKWETGIIWDCACYRLGPAMQSAAKCLKNLQLIWIKLSASYQ